MSKAVGIGIAFVAFFAMGVVSGISTHALMDDMIEDSVFFVIWLAVAMVLSPLLGYGFVYDEGRFFWQIWPSSSRQSRSRLVRPLHRFAMKLFTPLVFFSICVGLGTILGSYWGSRWSMWLGISNVVLCLELLVGRHFALRKMNQTTQRDP